MVEITCYAFNDDIESFDKFLRVFRFGCKEHRNCFEKVGFRSLFQKILDETKVMSKKFFGSLDHQSRVLETSFNLLKEKKIAYFDPETVEDLIEGNHDRILQLMKNPSIIQHNSKTSMLSLAKSIEKMNKSSKVDFKLIEQDL